MAITVLRRSLGKTREPLKIAEESRSRLRQSGALIAGFPVGLSYDANLKRRCPRSRPASVTASTAS